VNVTEQLHFPPFLLDLVNEQLWREDELVPLRPRAFALLWFLAKHAGRLLTKEELLKGVWPETRVTKQILKGYMHNLRAVLGDDAQLPRFIETVPRRGYRFIAAVSTDAPTPCSPFPGLPPLPSHSSAQGSQIQPEARHVRPNMALVGRDAELSRLHSVFATALRGERQIVFVTGEPGIGKTTLVETFLRGVGHREFGSRSLPFSSPNPHSHIPASVFWLGKGQCVEQHGAGEAYLPVLEALGRIGREPGGASFVAMLQQYAPTWLVQMPALVAAEAFEALQRRVLGATRERMLREMVEAMEAIAAARPLILWLEDLHWADASTVDWIAAIAQRRAPARLLVIGTYRPSDLSLSNHPLRAVKQELIAKKHGEELWLPFLTVDNVTQYLRQRYTRQQFPAGLGAAIHQRTDGNPLFVVNMVEYLAAQEVIVEVDGHWRLQTPVEEIGRGVPDGVRQLIEKHLERLSEEHQRMLEVASIAGVTFSATAVAAGTQTAVAQIEEWCEGLVKRGQFLQAQEARVLPDGTLCGSYRFQHALHQAVVYERIPSLRRVRLHRRIGEIEEQQYGDHVSAIASELAMHFERGGDLLRAVRYHQQAGHHALRQHGYQESITHFRRGLDLLATSPDTPERRQHELALYVALGAPLQALHGYSASEVEEVYRRARELSQGLGGTAQLFPALRGLYIFCLVRGNVQAAHELAEHLLSIAQSAHDEALLVEAHFAVGQTLTLRGNGVAGRDHLERGIALYDPSRHRSHALLYGQDPGVYCHLVAAWDLCLLGYPDQALQRNHEARAIAEAVGHPLSLAASQAFFAVTHQCRREGAEVHMHAEAAMELAALHGFPFFRAFGIILKGWALAEQGHTAEGLAHMREGLTAYRATGAELLRVRFLALLAEQYGKGGQPENGLHVLAEARAVINSDGARDYDAELYRLKGELTLQKGTGGWGLGARAKKKTRVHETGTVSQSTSTRPLIPGTSAEAQAEACFLKAIGIAGQQQTKLLELRTATSLARLWQQQGKRIKAHVLLSSIYTWFTEGFDTKDLQEAKALLDDLAAPSPSRPQSTSS